jgi:hypothetical protein
MPMKLVAVLLLALLRTPEARCVEVLEYRLNGVEIKAVYGRGTEARGLVDRFVAASPLGADGAPARWATHEGWRLMNALDGTISRVLQVRGEGSRLEAISSELDARRVPRRPLPAPLWLPPSTVITTAIEMKTPSPSRQWVARSPWSARGLTGWLRVAARLAGWSEVPSGMPSQLLLQRADEQVGIAVLPGKGGGDRGSVAVLTSWRQR